MTSRAALSFQGRLDFSHIGFLCFFSPASLRPPLGRPASRRVGALGGGPPPLGGPPSPLVSLGRSSRDRPPCFFRGPPPCGNMQAARRCVLADPCAQRLTGIPPMHAYHLSSIVHSRSALDDLSTRLAGLERRRVANLNQAPHEMQVEWRNAKVSAAPVAGDVVLNTGSLGLMAFESLVACLLFLHRCRRRAVLRGHCSSSTSSHARPSRLVRLPVTGGFFGAKAAARRQGCI